MDSRDFLKSLTPSQRAMLLERSDVRGLLHFGGQGALILLLAALIAMKGPGWPFLMLPEGILIAFLFPALHESVHRTAFNSLWLNKAVARACGFLILLPAEWFRYFHVEHHRFTQDPSRDPELLTLHPATRAQYFLYLTGLPLWLSHAKTLFRNAFGRIDDAFVPEHGRMGVKREAQAMLLLYAVLLGVSIALETSILLYVWIIPALIGQPFLRLFLLPEHTGCPNGPDVFENTRTTLTNRLVQRLGWNMSFHAEHHCFPAVPFHRLESFHMLTRFHLKVTSPGYLAFHREFLKGLK
ncbi:MAG: fatty acid desaturase [Alphaproteobacteria bacterium]|nr:MAG: fatty acid desaturase [Alphaproteobacteria bacterium]